MRAYVTMVAVSIVLLCTAGCSGCETPKPEPEAPDWRQDAREQGSGSTRAGKEDNEKKKVENAHEQGTGSPSEANGEEPSTSGAWQRHSSRLVAMQEKAERHAQDDAEIAELCVRVAGCRIPKNSSKYKDPNLNDPPNLYVIVKKGGREPITIQYPQKSGWDVTFPERPELEFDVLRSDDAQYRFEVYDARWGADFLVAVIPVAGKDIIKRVLSKLQEGQKPKPVELEDRASKSRVTITLEYVGVVRWYRLAAIDFPADSPARKAFDDTPQLQVRIYRDGKELPSSTGETRSVCLPPGWGGTFPKCARHCWKILERSDARYDVAVWDLGGWNQCIFTRSNLRGEDFRNPIIEPVGAFVDEARAGKVCFTRLSRPIEE